MKKLMLALLFLPAVSFADNVNFFSIGHMTLDDGLESVNAYTVGYQRVFDGNFSLSLSHLESLDDVCDDCDFQTLSANWALGSYNEGSFYLGVSHTDAGGLIGSSDGINIGYAKVNGVGLDYNVSASVVEGVAAYAVTLRAPIGDSGLGWQVGLADEDGVSTTMAGISIAF